MAGTTGLEPATSDVTGRRSNQLNYVPANWEDFSTILACETGAHNAGRAGAQELRIAEWETGQVV